MNPLAQELNQALKDTVVAQFLSPFGQNLYFPKGIVAQAAEAGKNATQFNATVGMAFLDGEPMILPTIQDNLPRLTPSEAVSYAPTLGDPKLRQLWKEQLVKKNPRLRPEGFSLPAVVPGITNGISQCAEVFVSEGDTVLLPDLCWDNYPLIFETKCGARLESYRMFDLQGRFDVEGLLGQIQSSGRRKTTLLVNFPHNPTGYTPTFSEMQSLSDGLKALAAGGHELMVLCDDAYFGLFYEDEVCRHSLFSYLHDLHPNLLAVKIDGATKEDYVWGFRIGFLTFAAAGLSEEAYKALDAKIMGAVRASISSSSRLGQTILYKELSSLIYHGIKDKYAKVLEERYRAVRQFLGQHQSPYLKPLPFNSGYFMTFEVQDRRAEELRKALLKEEGIGTISLSEGRYLRITFASVDARDIAALYGLVFEGARRLFQA